MNQLFRQSAFLIFFLLGTASQLGAAPKPTIPKKIVYIAIKSIDTAGMTITVEPRNSMSTEAKTYKVTTATVIKVNGNLATIADLKPDMQVHFTLAPDGVTANELDRSSAPRGSE